MSVATATMVTSVIPTKTIGDSEVELPDDDVLVDDCGGGGATVVMVVLLLRVVDDAVELALLLTVVVAAPSCTVSVSGSKRVDPTVAV